MCNPRNQYLAYHVLIPAILSNSWNFSAALKHRDCSLSAPLRDPKATDISSPLACYNAGRSALKVILRKVTRGFVMSFFVTPSSAGTRCRNDDRLLLSYSV